MTSSRRSPVLLLELAVSLALTIAGCTDFEDVPRGICGNGLLEPGEDCDAFDGRCVDCSVTCSIAQPCADYAAGMESFVCGADNVCHASTGQLEFVEQVAQFAETYRIADVDGDRSGDLLVQTSTSLDVLFGTSEGGFTSAQSQATPIAHGPATFVDLDGDVVTDVLLPTADGIAAFTSRYGAPAPMPFQSEIPPTLGDPRHIRAVSQGHLGIVGVQNGQLIAMVLDVNQVPVEPRHVTPMCDGKPDELVDGDDVAIIEVSGREIIVAAVLRAPGATRLCVVAMRPEGGGWTARNITPLNAPIPDSAPVLALQRGCPNLLFRTKAGILIEYPASNPPCTFFGGRPLAVDLGGAQPIPLGRYPLSDGELGVVLSVGAYDVRLGELVLAYDADRELTGVRVGDVNGDGLTDLVAMVAGAKDLDVLYRVPQQTGAAQFLRYRLATEGPVRRFELGDYDGNRAVDIAYVQNGVDRQELAVAYGTGDLFTTPALMGTFGEVRSVLPAQVMDSNDRANVVDDLAVILGGSDHPALALLHGSPQRTMLSFFDPRRARPADSFYRGALAGRFRTQDALDVLAFEEAGELAGTRVWLSNDGGNAGQITSLPSSLAVGFGNCDTDETLKFCYGPAGYVAWPSADGTHDLVVGVDSMGHGAVLDPAELSDALGNASESVALRPWGPVLPVVGKGARATVRSMHPFPALGRLALTYVVEGQPSVLLCTIDGDGVATGCEDLAALITAAGVPPVTCTDATPARLAPGGRFEAAPTATELVALCHGDRGAALFRVRVDGDGPQVTPAVRLMQRADELRAGDIDGDGLDDLVALDRSTTIPTLRVYRQCATRDVRCGGNP